ncbi:lipopolysaccharide biosynthesis protein [Patiriisocius marinus]|nr:polysaccharide biosynthesis C-terminal domain-containing protein [Patiriisocius marinus]
MQRLLKALSINKLSSLFLRMSAMASKFVIFTILSKYFDTDTYGVYSLQATTITIAIFILGFDFYNYAIRDILLNKERTATKVLTAMSLYAVSYVLFAVIGYVLFNQIDYFAQYTWLLIGICITEHLNQEIYRLLLAFKKVLVANILLFIRVAGWTLYVLYKLLLEEASLGIAEILIIWLSFNAMTLVLTLIIFAKPLITNLKVATWDKSWLIKGLKVSVIFYTATIFLKIIEYSNRYVVEAVLDESAAGIFSFYSNFAMVVTIYVSTIVVSYELPDLIESSTTDNFVNKLKRYKKLLFLHAAIASVVVVICMYPILIWQGKTEFIALWPLLLFLLGGAYLMNVSLLYHAYLYIKHREKKLLEIVIISGIINIIATWILTYYYGLYGAASAFLVTAIVIFILRRKAAPKQLMGI